MSAQANVTDSVEVLSTNGDFFVVGMTRMPAVDRIVKGILNENPYRGINPGENVAMDAAIQNVKRWCDSF
jgi:molecular chaperone DnaK (HSP70)